MTSKTCSYLDVEIVSLPVKPNDPPIQRTVFRCRLAEAMLARLEATSAGQQIAQDLQAKSQDGEVRAACGPDLGLVYPQGCSSERLEQLCRSNFVAILTSQRLDASVPAPEETETVSAP